MLWQELKKIWRPGMVLMILVLGFVFYAMYLEGNITYFPADAYGDGELRVAADWMDRYGTTISPEEMAEIEANVSGLLREADEAIAANRLAQMIGLRDWKDYQNYLDTWYHTASGTLEGEAWERYTECCQLMNYVQGEETGNIDGRLYATQVLSERYRCWQREQIHFHTAEYDQGYSSKELEHFTQFFAGDAWQNILPAQVPEVTARYFAYLLVWMVLSAGLLVSVVPVRDRLRGMTETQWSSKRGRRWEQSRFGAAMLSAFGLTLGNLAIFGGIFLTNGTLQFDQCRLFSFMDTGFSWANWTYGNWWMMLVLMCLVMTMAFAALAYLLARGSGNYIAMLLKLLPLFVVGALCSVATIDRAFYVQNSLYQMTHLPYIEGMVTGLILGIAGGCCLIGWRRVRKAELNT